MVSYGLPPTGAAGGDLSGTYPNPSVKSAAQDFTVAGTLTTGGNGTVDGSLTINTDLTVLGLSHLSGVINSSASISTQPANTGATVLSVNVNASDSFDRFRMLGDTSMHFGPGNVTRDTTWGRLGVAQIGSSDSDIIAGLAGKGFMVKEGSNAKMGTVTVNGATPVVVSTTAVTANSRIFLTLNTVGGTPAFSWVSARTAGTSFSVTSAAGNTSTLAWLIVEPA